MLAHSVGEWKLILGCLAEPPGCDDAMHCKYGTETKKLGKHLKQFCRIFSNWAPCHYARLKICLSIAATGWSCHNGC